MTSLLSPLAPAYPWTGLDDHSGIARTVDLRDPAQRLQVIRSAYTHSINLMDFIGAPWSILTDDEAGIVLAEAIRQIGPDGRGPIPALLGRWARFGSAGQRPGYVRWERRTVVGPRRDWSVVLKAHIRPESATLTGQPQHTILWEQASG